MKKSLYFLQDILRCMVVGFAISLGLSIISGLILLIIFGTNAALVFGWIKSINYFVGAMGLLLSGGFFMKRDGTRPLIYKDEWKKYFKQMNIGFVVMFISLFIVLVGVLIHYNLDIRSLL